MELTHDQPTVFAEPIDYWLEGIFAVALLVSIAVLASIARAGLSRRAALVGWTVAAACHGALLVAAAATTMDGRETLDALFAPGFLAIIADHATLARGRHPERLMRGGLVLLAAFAATVLVDDNLVAGAGGLVLAATWAALSRLIATPDLVTTPMRPLVRGYGEAPHTDRPQQRQAAEDAASTSEGSAAPLHLATPSVANRTRDVKSAATPCKRASRVSRGRVSEVL